jgi:hypothetical protein
MAKKIIRVISRAANGSLRTKEFDDFNEISELHEQIGIDDCSTDLSLRGMPLFRGLVGPIPESKTVARYESPDVFEFMTKEWAQIKTKRKRRSKSEVAAAADGVKAETKQATEATPPTKHILIPKMNIGNPAQSTLANF